MGGGNSSLNISKNINESITKFISNTMQSISAFSNIDQELNLHCGFGTQRIGPGTYPDTLFYPNCFNNIKQEPIHNINDLIVATQSCLDNDTNIPFFTCSAKNINLNNFINIKLIQENSSIIMGEIQNNINSNLQQMAKNQLGPLQFDDKTQNIINGLSESISNQTFLSSLFDKFSQKSTQTINIYSGVTVDAITITNTQDIISNQINNDTQIQKNITDLTTNISQIAKSSYGADSAGKIVIIVVGILIMFGLIIMLIKKISHMDKRKSKKD